MNKLVKYRLLRHLPGELGRRYEYKLMARTDEFDKALRASAGMACVDLGANLGEYTRKMACRTRQVIAFEPDPWTCAALRANVADLGNVKIENAAAGTSYRRVLLYRHPRFGEDPLVHSASSSVVAGKNNVVEDGAIEVRQVDFVSYLEDLDEDIGVLKIDIEGAEVDLLEALFDRPDVLMRINHIFAETHERRIPSHKPRVKALRARAERLKRPYINLYWH